MYPTDSNSTTIFNLLWRCFLTLALPMQQMVCNYGAQLQQCCWHLFLRACRLPERATTSSPNPQDKSETSN
eukprot:3505425-Amphidinium_carterae.1